MENIIGSLCKHSFLSQKSIAELTGCFVRHEFPKRHVLIEGGKYNYNYYFIEKGITRSYVLLEGKEITHWFSKEGDVTFSMQCCYDKLPAFEHVELLERGILYSIPAPQLETLYNSNIEIANWGRILHQHNYQLMHLRHISRLNESAYERYERLLSDDPQLFHRVNLGYIASYLGMTQVMLSNLRRKK